jgi:hypothetical protein
VQPLHRHEALEAAHAGEARQVHRGHAAGRNFAHQLVAIDALAAYAGIEELGGHVGASEPSDSLKTAAVERRPRRNGDAGAQA